ncbi:MAG: MFS transporter [Lachnospiraceae bacterium]
MVTILLIVIYIAFIGLGIPDSLFGTAWPAIYTEYGLPISLGGVITMVTFIGTTISSLLSARLIRKFGTARLTAGCTLLTALALLGFSFSHSFVVLIILAVPLGLGAGSIDTALNNYVASHYNASQMSFLHCFYGVGVTVSPFILTLVFRNDTNWRIGYGIATIIQFAIAAIVIFSLPLWNRVRDKNEISESAIKSLSVIEASKIRGVKVMWLLFLCTCSIELTVGAWSSTFLVESRGATEELAAGTITFYYLGMTSGRFLSGVLARKIHSRTIITIGSVILGIALLMLTITNNSYIAIAALFLIGLGNGPLFPNLNYLTPEQFGEERSAALIGAQMAVANIGIVISPLLFGFLGQALGMGLFGYYLLFFYFFLVIGVILNRKQFRKNE